MRITVVGLGKIGLPLAVHYAAMGHQVTGADINAATVAAVAAGEAPFPGEAGLDQLLAQVVTTGSLMASSDTTTAVRSSDAVVVVVPLFASAEGTPDFAAMDSATDAVGRGLTPGTLVVYETTVPVGTTRGRFLPALEKAAALSCGTDFFLAFSPERVLTGRVFADLRRYPKLVGGVDPESAGRAVAFYNAVLEFDERPDLPRGNGVWDLGSAEASELAKLAETTYRDVNIALANRFAVHAEEIGVDVHQVIEASNSQPFSHIHRPGIAVGGHCIPIYPKLYLWSDPGAALVRVARGVNEEMPGRVVERLAGELGGLDGLVVVVLGASYRGGVKETAFSGVFPTVEALRERGARPVVHDPLYDADELAGLGLEAYVLGEHCDAVVVQADHEVYRTIGAESFPGVRVILDGRAVTDAACWSGVTRLVVGVGRVGGA
jgi:UDP-N-acetyl-D-glucosamine dehydrogenase